MMRLFESAAEAALVRRALAGQRDAFATLVERYLPLVHSLALAHTGRIHDADDIAQETFCRALERLNTLREPRRFSHWLAAIARNLAMDTHRDRARVAPGDVPEGIIEPQHDQAELHALVREKLDALDPTHREILWLHYYGGYSLRDAAHHLNIHTEAAKKRLQRARAALGDELMAALAPDPATWTAKRQLILAALAKVPAPESTTVAAQTGAVLAAVPITVKLLTAVAATGVIATSIVFTLTSSPDVRPVSTTLAAPSEMPPNTLADTPLSATPESGLPVPATPASMVAARAPQENSNAIAYVTGRILDTRGQAIPYVRISAHRSLGTSTPVSTRADASGRYKLTVPANLPYTVRVDFHFDETRLEPSSFDVSLAPNETRDDIDFTIEGDVGLRVDGRVLTPNGSPCSEPQIRVSGQGWSSVVGDEAGEFHILGLKPGQEILLSAQKPGVGHSGEVKATAGANNVIIQLMPPTNISGQVVFPDGSPVTEFNAIPKGVGGMGSTFGNSDWTLFANPDGRFQFHDVIGEKVVVTAVAPGYAPTSGVRDANPGGVLDDLLIQLVPESKIVGTVTKPDGTPIANATVQTYLENGLADLEGEPVLTDANGKYAMSGLSAGTYNLRAKSIGTMPQYEYEVSVDSEEHRVVNWVLGPGGTITLNLLRNGTPVSGEVIISNSGVSRMASSRGTPKRDFTDVNEYCLIEQEFEGGKAVFDGLPAQKYYIQARLLTPQSADNWPKWGGGFGGTGAPPGVKSFTVTLDTAEQVVRDLEFGGVSQISGEVRHGEKPVASAQVGAKIAVAGIIQNYRTETNADGKYLLVDLPAGEVQLFANYGIGDGEGASIRRHFVLSEAEIRVESFDGTNIGHLCGNISAAVGHDRPEALILLPDGDIPTDRPYTDKWGVVGQYDIVGSTGAIVIPGALRHVDIETGLYRLVALDRRGTLLASPIDIEIRPGETTRVDF